MLLYRIEKNNVGEFNRTSIRSIVCIIWNICTMINIIIHINTRQNMVDCYWQNLFIFVGMVDCHPDLSCLCLVMLCVVLVVGCFT